MGRFRVVLAALLILVASGCASPNSKRDASTRPISSSTTKPESGPTKPDESASTSTMTTPVSPTEVTRPIDVREFLAQLSINDQPHTGSDYHRDAWPHWDDIDGDGCNARQQALRAASTTPAQVDYPCQVIAGDWVSAYDGFTTSNPGDLDIDHVVPLENAHFSGGWKWTIDQRRQYANEQGDLWAVSASSNRSKGASPPDQWRPPRQDVWCQYAQRWTFIKVRWGLTATTAERDALGQMLDTCPAGTLLSPSPPPTTTPSTPAGPASTAPTDSSTYYANCAAARTAGAAPLHRGEQGYRPGLDRDRDGIACE